MHKFLKVFFSLSDDAHCRCHTTAAYFAWQRQNTQIHLSNWKDTYFIRCFEWVCFFCLYFYFVDDERIERKAAKSNNRPTKNRCRIPIDDKIYFYIFLKVEVKLAVPSIVYWYRAYTYAIHWNFDFWWAFSGSALLSHLFVVFFLIFIQFGC